MPTDSFKVHHSSSFEDQKLATFEATQFDDHSLFHLCFDGASLLFEDLEEDSCYNCHLFQTSHLSTPH